jgi:hypothetical protein
LLNEKSLVFAKQKKAFLGVSFPQRGWAPANPFGAVKLNLWMLAQAFVK